MELGGLDLNALVALDLLVQERSVTRAAQRAGVTQSAMSHTLRRLRAQFDDPLLVRVGAGMALTPRAEALAVSLRAGLRILERVLEPPGFEPSVASRTFRVAAPDLFDALVLPRIVQLLRSCAPGVALVAGSTDGDDLHERLASGDLDVAVHSQGMLGRPGALVGRTLFRETISAFLHRDHPALDGATLDRDGWLATPHAMVSPRGEGPGPVDAALAAVGLQRRIALRLSNFSSAPRIIAESDLILMAPTGLTRLLPPDGPLVCRPAPVPIPDFGVVMLWHPRFTEDPANRWLRERLFEATADLRPA